jgi:hypothetical protein
MCGRASRAHTRRQFSAAELVRRQQVEHRHIERAQYPVGYGGGEPPRSLQQVVDVRLGNSAHTGEAPFGDFAVLDPPADAIEQASLQSFKVHTRV